MSLKFTAKGICERALRKIGAFAINDSAADPSELQEALFWLDLNVAELAGTGKLVWLKPSVISIPLTANTATYNPKTILANTAPADGILFYTYASLRDSSGFDEPLEFIRRNQYEDITDKDATGRPAQISIDRLESQNISVHPVPIDGSYTLRLDVQTYAPDLTKSGAAHGFSAEWQRWLILSTAAEIGDGPVRRLPIREVDSIKRDAELSKSRLMGFSNRESLGNSPRRTKPWGR